MDISNVRDVFLVLFSLCSKYHVCFSETYEEQYFHLESTSRVGWSLTAFTNGTRLSPRLLIVCAHKCTATSCRKFSFGTKTDQCIFVSISSQEQGMFVYKLAFSPDTNTRNKKMINKEKKKRGNEKMNEKKKKSKNRVRRKKKRGKTLKPVVVIHEKSSIITNGIWLNKRKEYEKRLNLKKDEKNNKMRNEKEKKVENRESTKQKMKKKDFCPKDKFYRLVPSVRLCYKGYISRSVVASWMKAREMCSINKGDLISIDTMEKYEHMQKNLVKNHAGHPLWVGLKSEDGGKSYKWVSGSKKIPNWKPGYPYCKNECAVIMTPGFSCYPCSRAFGYICEIPF